MTLNDIRHPKLVQWVNDFAALTTPDNIVIADGSQEQYDEEEARRLETGEYQTKIALSLVAAYLQAQGGGGAEP